MHRGDALRAYLATPGFTPARGKGIDVVRMVIGHTTGPFSRYLGFEEVMLLLLPVALTGLAIWLAVPRGDRSAWAKPALWAIGVLCLTYCSVPISHCLKPNVTELRSHKVS